MLQREIIHRILVRDPQESELAPVSNPIRICHGISFSLDVSRALSETKHTPV